jgi:hypothetical protein
MLRRFFASVVAIALASYPFVAIAAAPEATVNVTVVSGTVSTGNVMAGCPMYQNDTRITRDISSMAVSTSDASDKAATTDAWNNFGNFNSLGDGPYKLHVFADATTQPQTTLHNEVSGQSYGSGSYSQTGHNPPGQPNVPYPIGSFTNTNALTNGSGDQAMEMISQGGYAGMSGHSSANGCEVIDGYYMTYIGSSASYSSSNMWAAYTACMSDPNGNMVGEVCNSNASLSGIEIAAGLHAEQIVASRPSGWSALNHALLAETPCSNNGPLCESSKKMRLRVCGDDDAVANDNNAGTNCVAMPNASTSPQAYAIAYALRHYGLFLSDNGCCFNIARNYTPLAGDTDMNYSQINAWLTSVNAKDFDEMSSNS